jgi:sodium-dependent dicarboxylate transporter 2/3/5
MLPATISASFAFMLPVATPPNAIVFGSGKVSINQMIRTGIILNLLGVIIISSILFFILKVL